MPTFKIDAPSYTQYICTLPSDDLQPLALEHLRRGTQHIIYGTIALCVCFLPITCICGRLYYVHYLKAKAIHAEMESRGLEAVRGSRWSELTPAAQKNWLEKQDPPMMGIEGLEDLVRRGYPLHEIVYYNAALVAQARSNVEAEKPEREARRLAYEQGVARGEKV